MDWEKVGKNVAEFAPAIGAAIGGPVGSVVGLGVRALCDLFGIEPDAKDAAEQMDAALNSMTPEQAIALKKADQDFQKEMKSLDVDVFKYEVQDRDSARQREMKVGSWDTRVLSWLIVGGFGVTVWAVLSGNMSTVVDGMVAGTLIGYVSSKADVVVSYFFGSSMGSKQKTDQLGQALTRTSAMKK